MMEKENEDIISFINILLLAIHRMKTSGIGAK